jgi:DNA-binding transcriptional ArsR family regulator
VGEHRVPRTPRGQTGVDKRSRKAEHTGIVDQSLPDYPLEAQLELTEPAQYRALFDDVRTEIVRLLGERAATISELADALGRPKGTIGYHVNVLADVGLIHVVRTKRVRAVEAKYYGRRARVFLFQAIGEATHRDEQVLATAAAEVAAIPPDSPLPSTVNVRYARIPVERAAEWRGRLEDLITEFAAQPRAGDVTFGLVAGIYPTDRPALPTPGRRSRS